MNYEKAFDKLVEQVRSSPNREHHMMIKTFWGLFTFKRRTQKRIDQVYADLQRRGLLLDIDKKQFPKEPDNKWLTLKLFEIQVPEDRWFESMKKKTYESEKEVENFFITPLFLNLGYDEEDFSYGHPIKIPQKLHAKNQLGEHPSFPDLIIFNGNDRSPENVLIILEAKKSILDQKKDQELLDTAESEAKLYAAYMPTHICVVTNGDSLRIFDPFPNEGQDSPIMFIHRSELKEKWNSLYMILGKQTVLERKK